MNKKILSFTFGLLMVFSIFGAIDFQEVNAQTWSATVTSKTSGTSYFNSNAGNPINMDFDVKIAYNIPAGNPLENVWITVPTGYVLQSVGSQPTPPSGWSIDYGNSDADGVTGATTMAYTRATGISGSSTITFTVKLVEAPAAEGAASWTISDNGSAGLTDQEPNTIIDNTAPKFDLKYIKSPKVETSVNPFIDILGLGSVQIRLVSDEPIAPTSSTADRPVVKVKQINKTETTVTMTSQSGTYPDTTFNGTYSITSTSGASDGLATVTVTAKDRAGNIGTVINNATSLGYDGASFIVDSQCSVPTLNAPDNGATQPSPTVAFEWQEIPDNSNKYVTYTLQYSTSSTFSSNVVTVAGPFDDDANTYLGSGTAWAATGSVRSYTTDLIAGTYYWRVKAADSLNNESGYSEVRSFSITSSDLVPPNFRIRYLKTPKIDYNTTPDVLGSGAMTIKIYANEVLKQAPTVQVKLHNQTTWTNVTMTPSGQSSIYTGTYTISATTYNNGLAQVTVSGQDLANNVGSSILPSQWDSVHLASPYPQSEGDSDGPNFYVDTAADSPNIYGPDNGYVIPGNNNEANFTFYRISDLSAERPPNSGQNNCLTYHVQYSTSSTFTTNVITESVDIDESGNIGGNDANFCTPDPVAGLKEYNKWFIIWDTKPAGLNNLRMHKSQALANGVWYWRAFATDKLGNQSPYSETRSFTVSTVAPNLYAPADLSLILINNPTLQWYNVPSAVSYNLRLSRGDTNFLDYTLYPDDIAVNIFLATSDADNGNGDIMDYEIATSTPPNPAIGNLEDGVWYWKVASNLDVTVYSETWRFTVDSTGPPAPYLQTPYNGEVTQNKRPQFTWSAVTDVNNLSPPVRYYIQISGDSTFPNSGTPSLTWIDDSDFAPWASDTYQRGPFTVTNFTSIGDFPETESGEAYYWRVYAKDSAGNTGSNSLVYNFRVDTTPPLQWGDDQDGDNDLCETIDNCDAGGDPADVDKLALALTAPTNGLVIQSRYPVIEWRHSSCRCVRDNISSYIIQFSQDITFPPGATTEIVGVFQVTGVPVDPSNTINMGYSIQNPLYNGTYFWRVAAIDPAGNRTQFTGPWSFTVNVPGNETQPQCSNTVPCPSGFTCQAGVCVPVTMSPGDLTITVQTSTGTAIAGATVTVDGTAQTTNAAGQVVFAALTGGSHTINNVVASGYTDHGTSVVSVNGATSQTITMVTTGTEGYVWGTVYFDQIGTGAPNILIDIYNQSTDVKVDSRLTNSEGSFQSSPLPSGGNYYIKIPAYEKELRDLQPTSLTTGEKIIILETKGTVTGIVQDDSGQIVSGATVVLKKYPGEEFVDTKTTNTIGQFSFDAIPGSYVVTISKAGYDAYTSSSFSVQSRETVNLQTVLGNIVLNAIRGTLTVSVKDDKGATINTATVTIRSSTGGVVRSITTSGGTGSTQLAPGTYRVSAVSSGYAESLQQTTNINSNQTSSVSISLAPATGSIRVVAKDPSGAPMAGASVYVDGTLSGITDENGELLITGLKLGEHTVRISKGGYSTIEEQVTAGETTSVVDTALRRNYLPYILVGLLAILLVAAALYYFKFRKQEPKRPTTASKGLTLPGRPTAPKLRPHRHKGGLPPSSIRVKKKNL